MKSISLNKSTYLSRLVNQLNQSINQIDAWDSLKHSPVNLKETDRAAGFLGGSPVSLSRDDSDVCCSGCSGNKLSCSSDGSPSKYSLTLSSDILRRRSPAVREGGGTRDAFIFTCSIYRFLVAMFIGGVWGSRLGRKRRKGRQDGGWNMEKVVAIWG